MITEIPTQKKMIKALEPIPIEHFEWGQYPDHFKIEMPHRHEFAELLFFVDGEGTHEIDYHQHDILSNAIHYIPKSCVHFLKRGKHSSGFTVSFDTDYFEKNNTHKFINPLKQEAFVLNLSPSTFALIQDQVKQVLHQIKQDSGYFRQKCFLLTMELILNTIAAEQNQVLLDKAPHKESELVRNFKESVLTYVHKHHHVSWYAQRLHISQKHLGNEVKKNLGISAKQYILEALLISIKRNLLDSNKTIEQIAFDHNYDASSLGKLFKKQVGNTMNEFRSYKNME